MDELPQADREETHGCEGWSFGTDGAKKTSDHTYKVRWYAEAKMRAYGDARAAAAILAERERCAKVCESQRVGIDAFGGIDHHISITREQCAAAIRKDQ